MNRRAFLTTSSMSLIAAAACLSSSGCDETGDGVGGPSNAPQLRLVNGGSASLEQLSALFPQEEVSFGDVRPSGTTAYRTVTRASTAMPPGAMCATARRSFSR